MTMPSIGLLGVDDIHRASGDCSPFGPLAVTLRSLIVTVTPLTGAIGFLPVRDILLCFLRSNRHTAGF